MGGKVSILPGAARCPRMLLLDLSSEPDMTAAVVVWKDSRGEMRCSHSSMRRSDQLSLIAWAQFDALYSAIKDQDE